MNLAAEYQAADVRKEDVTNRIEALLTALFPEWVSWCFMKPDGIEVYGVPDNARAAAVLRARGFMTVILHRHLASEQMFACRCVVREAG